MTPEEVIARFICTDRGYDPEEPRNLGPAETAEPMWEEDRDAALDLIAALHAAGFKILGREPTEAMVVVYAGTDAPRVLAHLGDEAVGTWQAMWDAAEPSLPTGGTTGVADAN